jgi:beta-carotene 3-hydroxylase
MDFCGTGINPIIQGMYHTVERNDLFALVFSTPCMGLLFYATLVKYNPYVIAVAVGIFCYGAFYFIFHDLIVHQRLKFRIKRKSKYLQRIIHAHHIHHSKRTKDGCEAFGFFNCPGNMSPNSFPLH